MESSFEEGWGFRGSPSFPESPKVSQLGLRPPFHNRLAPHLNSSQVPFAASAKVCAVVPPNPEAPPEAPPVADVVPEAPQATLEAVPEASVVMSEAPPEIDCNVDAAIL
ncbi:hypothetical protein AAC387_Pa06g2429 [Persea americana]